MPQQNRLQAGRRPNAPGARERDVRICIEENARSFDRGLRRMVSGLYWKLQAYHDEIVSDAFAAVLENAERVAETYEQAREQNDLLLKTWVYGWLRRRALRACSRYQRQSARRRVFRDHGEEDKDGAYHRPSVVVAPEQEEVVFRKQLLAACGALPPEEQAVMMLTMDKATIKEIMDELGLSMAQLMDRRVRGLARLAEKAAPT